MFLLAFLLVMMVISLSIISLPANEDDERESDRYRSAQRKTSGQDLPHERWPWALPAGATERHETMALRLQIRWQAAPAFHRHLSHSHAGKSPRKAHGSAPQGGCWYQSCRREAGAKAHRDG